MRGVEAYPTGDKLFSHSPYLHIKNFNGPVLFSFIISYYQETKSFIKPTTAAGGHKAALTIVSTIDSDEDEDDDDAYEVDDSSDLEVTVVRKLIYSSRPII